MTIRVPVEELGVQLAKYGIGTLIPAKLTDYARVHTVVARMDGDRVIVPATMARNAAKVLDADRRVTLVFSPYNPRGYTLLIDGLATMIEDPQPAEDWQIAGPHRPETVHVDAQPGYLAIEVESAMLHRPHELSPKE